MRLVVTLFVCAATLSGVAAAQTASTPAGNTPPGVYVEAVAQSAFGNVTSQSYGAEAGIRVARHLVIFAEGGRTRDTGPPSLSANAQLIGAYLAASQNKPVAYVAKQPVTFGNTGLKYVVPVGRHLEPYVLGGMGLARYTRSVTFLVGGTDVTANIAQYGVVLGSDLEGSTTKPMVVAGAGAVWAVHGPFLVDFQFRFGRILADGEKINLSRAGVGLGVGF